MPVLTMHEPPESLSKLFQVGSPRDRPSKRPNPAYRSKNVPKRLTFLPTKPFPLSTRMFSLNINPPATSLHRGRGRALWRAETTRLSQADHCYPPPPAAPMQNPVALIATPSKEEFTSPAAHFATSHEPAPRFSAERTPESSIPQRQREEWW